MTATTTLAPNHELVPHPSPTRPRLLVPGLISGGIAAAATSTTVLVAQTAGVVVAVGGKQIPVGGFAQLVLVGALIGIALARMFSRRAQRPRSTFVRTTVVLTALVDRARPLGPGLEWVQARADPHAPDGRRHHHPDAGRPAPPARLNPPPQLTQPHTNTKASTPCPSTCCPSGTTIDYDPDFSDPEVQRQMA